MTFDVDCHTLQGFTTQEHLRKSSLVFDTKSSLLRWTLRRESKFG